MMTSEYFSPVLVNGTVTEGPFNTVTSERCLITCITATGSSAAFKLGPSSETSEQ